MAVQSGNIAQAPAAWTNNFTPMFPGLMTTDANGKQVPLSGATYADKSGNRYWNAPKADTTKEQDKFEPISLLKNPGGEAGWQNAIGDFSKMEFPDFKAVAPTTTAVTDASKNVSTAQDRYAQSLDPSALTKQLNDALAKVSNLTARYSSDVAGVGAADKAVQDEYQRKAMEALAARDAATKAAETNMLQEMQNRYSGVLGSSALGQMRSRATGGPGSLSSSERSQLMNAAVAATLPGRLAIDQMYRSDAASYLPVYGEIADRGTSLVNRDYNRYGDVYGREVSLADRGVTTATVIQDLQQTAARNGVDAAIAKLRSLSLPLEVANQIQQSLLASVSGRLGVVGQIGASDPYERSWSYQDPLTQYGANYPRSSRYGSGGGGGDQAGDGTFQSQSQAPQTFTQQMASKYPYSGKAPNTALRPVTGTYTPSYGEGYNAWLQSGSPGGRYLNQATPTQAADNGWGWGGSNYDVNWDSSSGFAD